LEALRSQPAANEDARATRIFARDRRRDQGLLVAREFMADHSRTSATTNVALIIKTNPPAPDPPAIPAVSYVGAMVSRNGLICAS
jgi:hypothetical protein